jgi:hypothetical protein
MLQFFYHNEWLFKKYLELHYRIFSFPSSFVRTLSFSPLFLYFLLSLILSCMRCLLHVLPAAPAAALAALERPSVATIGASVAAARAAPRRSSPFIGGVLVAGFTPALGRRQLAG